MTLWTLLPVKPFEEAKTRLAAEFSPAERRDLAAGLFQRTLEVIQAFAGSRPVLVVTRSPAIAALSRARGAEVFEEQGNERGDAGLNSALTDAAFYARRRGATGVLAVASDLPLLCQGDLIAMTDIPDGDCAIAPDRWQRGTNALLWQSPRLPVYHYGPNSYLSHCAAIEARGAVAYPVFTPGLALDVDHPDDLRLWSSMAENSLRAELSL